MSDLLAAASRVPGLVLELRSDTQHATAYLRGRPFATVQRKRATDRTPGAAWTVYSLKGERLGGYATARGAVSQVEVCAQAEGEGEPACVVTLAPNYAPRSDLRLAVDKVSKGFTLIGYAHGHAFHRLTINGQPAPTFRRKADAAEYATIIGLRAAQRQRRGRRHVYPAASLDAASPVACVVGKAGA